jgi:beta-glucosidase
MARAVMYFPSDFRWGTVSSAHQVEGNNENNDWWQWEQEDGHILNNDRSAQAVNWWEDATPDLDRAAELGTNAHRLSLEWSRIEPQPSVFDGDAIGRYREILTAMHARGIEPMVTLHHFTNPLWLAEKGDFNSELVAEYFQRFTSKVVNELGDLIPKWVTINEPVVYVVLRYLQDRFPNPLHHGQGAARQALSNMLACHAAAYHTIKEAFPLSLVGMTKRFTIAEPQSEDSKLDAWSARQVSRVINELWMESLVTGKSRWAVGRGKVANLANAFDFIGINYYSRTKVRFSFRPARMTGSFVAQGITIPDRTQFEDYAEGLFKTIKACLRFNKPIYITANGIADSDDDSRPSFILNHLREVWRAISYNFPVMGYYHSNLIDSFEWDRGWTQRFGLIEYQPEADDRLLRPSGRLYKEICQTFSISSDMASQYAPHLLETMFPGKTPESVFSEGPKDSIESSP